MRDLQPRASGNLVAFYHLWAPGKWKEPLSEFLAALDESGFDGPLKVGLVGTMAERRAALAAVTRDCEVVVAVERGYEQVTLAAVREYAILSDGAVLYSHGKGSARDYSLQRPWRREVVSQVVSRWRENLALLENADVLGSSWQNWDPEPGGFLANVWMARCDYLRTLPLPDSRRRTAAETWLGLGSPRVADIAPGRMRFIPTDGRPGDREIKVSRDELPILISENGETTLAVQVVPREWLPDVEDRIVWRILKPEEARAWRASWTGR